MYVHSSYCTKYESNQAKVIIVMDTKARLLLLMLISDGWLSSYSYYLNFEEFKLCLYFVLVLVQYRQY